MSEPKHRLISRQLLTEIAAGKYSTGRLPSEAQLSEQFKVSRPTVARALRDLQEQGLIERRVGSGSYVRTAAEGGPPAARRQLGLMIPGLGTTEIFDVICGELAGLCVFTNTACCGEVARVRSQRKTRAYAHVDELCEQFLHRQVSGVFFAPFEHKTRKEETNQRLTERLRQAGIAVVLIDRDMVAFPARSDFDLVGIDNFAGGFMLAEHLLKLGCRHLAFVARPLSAPTVDVRIAGTREALRAHQRDVPSDLVRVGEPEDVKFARSLAAGRKVDAVICANDYTAAALIRSLEKAGVHVPHDVRVVGFDDVKYAKLLTVPLTTMHQPCRDIAVVAFRAMQDRIADPTLPPRSFVLSPTLVVRESCGAYLDTKTRIRE